MLFYFQGIRKLGLKFRNTFLAFGGGIPPNEVRMIKLNKFQSYIMISLLKK